MSIILAVALLLLTLGGVVVRKTYYALPILELKRQAEQHKPLASVIYPAVAYGNSLRSLLWLYMGLTGAASIVLLSRSLPVWVSLLIVAPLLWVTFSWLPASRVGGLATELTKRVTPSIVWLLNYLHPVLSRGADKIEKHQKLETHTGLFERADLVQLIEQQQRQRDNRLSDEELEIAKRALSFDEHKVRDILTPSREIMSVLADDPVGPVLIDELHRKHQEYVLVRESKKGPVIGTLEFKQFDLHSKGKVSDIMKTKVYYVHENDSLSDALHAFFVTNHAMFVVVNSFEEYVGIITVESILKQLLGHVPGDDFDQYANLAAVAARHAKHQEVGQLEDLSDESTEALPSSQS